MGSQLANYGAITAPNTWDRLSGLDLPLLGVFGDLGDWVQALSDISGFSGLRDITERAIHPSVMDPGPFSAENLMDSVEALGLLTGAAEAAPYARPAMEAMAARLPNLRNEIGAVGPGVEDLMGLGAGVTTPNAFGKQLRGPRPDGVNSYDNLVNYLAENNIPIDPEFRLSENLADDWYKYGEIAQNAPLLDPVILPGKGSMHLRKVSGEGFFPEGSVGYGNEKTGFYSPTFPHGKCTPDRPGCGRGAFMSQLNEWLRLNEAPETLASACYTTPGQSGIECYASAQARGRGSDLINGMTKRPVAAGAKRTAMEEYIKANGLDMFQQNFPDVLAKPIEAKWLYDIKNVNRGTGITKKKIFEEIEKNGPGVIDEILNQYPDISITPLSRSPWSLSREINYPAATVFADYEKAPIGTAVRGGVTSTGDAYFQKPVMDALYKAAPENPFVFINANYHNKDLAGLMGHPLQERSIINNTVSGWFSPAEFLSRVNQGVKAKDAGWNSLWRYVNADTKVFPEAAHYNRYLKPLQEATDMPVFAQPLHTVGGGSSGNKYSSVPGGLMGCCESPAPGALRRTCANCEVGDGLAPQFLDRWGIREGEEEAGKVLPGLPFFIDDAKARQPFNFGG